ncbi:MAG: DUF3472 domain-containing protein [Acidimicrobiia bacterium]|nr:DUF3472 domain-containing protein [Acidimicrobiia bacterium]
MPGPDPGVSADWAIAESAVPGAYHLHATAQSESLRIVDGKVAMDHGRQSAESVRGDWRLEAIADGAPYVRILDAADPSRALLVRRDELGSTGALELALEVVEADDAAAMWRIDEECVADARSIHLRYVAPRGIALFYNEVEPVDAPPGTYFCTSGFGSDSGGPGPSGYGGVQRLMDGSWMVIFSVWHRMADEATPVADALATAVAVGEDAYGTAFSGEGSGSSIRMPIDLTVGAEEPIRFVVTAESLADDTVLSAYVLRGGGSWISLGAILRARTGGRLMSGLYGFVEDFARTGNLPGVPPTERSPYQARSAQFSNPWVGTAPPDQGLHAITQATVGAYSPHPLENLTAELQDRRSPFGMLVATGGRPAEQPPALGSTLADASAEMRIPPNLDGVPWR